VHIGDGEDHRAEPAGGGRVCQAAASGRPTPALNRRDRVDKRRSPPDPVKTDGGATIWRAAPFRLKSLCRPAFGSSPGVGARSPSWPCRSNCSTSSGSTWSPPSRATREAARSWRASRTPSASRSTRIGRSLRCTATRGPPRTGFGSSAASWCSASRRA
jgi:hypothetical protein